MDSRWIRYFHEHALAVRIEELVMEMKKKYNMAIVTHNMLKATRIWDSAAFFFSGERAGAVLPGRSSL